MHSTEMHNILHITALCCLFWWGCVFDSSGVRQHSFFEIDPEIFSMVILSIQLILERQLSVSGKRMCTSTIKFQPSILVILSLEWVPITCFHGEIRKILSRFPSIPPSQPAWGRNGLTWAFTVSTCPEELSLRLPFWQKQNLVLDPQKLGTRVLSDAYMDCVKQKSAFEYAQNMQIQIILCMHKLSFGPSLSSHTLCSIQWFC